MGLAVEEDQTGIRKRSAMAIYYRCKIYGREHLSPATFGNKELFESSTLIPRTFECPVTGRSASYEKRDTRWKK
jgi:hypothetical protein